MILLSSPIPLQALVIDIEILAERLDVAVKEQLSPYRMTKFKRCPRNFFYRALDLPGVMADDAPAEFGKMLHQAQERFYEKIPEKPTPAKIIQTVNLALEKEWLPRFQTKQNTAKKAMANFILFEQWRLKEAKKNKIPYKVVEDGETVDPIIEVDIESKNYHAIVDFYWEAYGFLADWKFGKSDTVYDGYKIQLSIEKHVLLYNDKMVNFAGIGFLRKYPQPKKVAIYGINTLNGIRSSILSAVERQSFPRKESPLCWYCEDFIRCFAEKNNFDMWTGVFK